jgi:hypothetical protein
VEVHHLVLEEVDLEALVDHLIVLEEEEYLPLEKDLVVLVYLEVEYPKKVEQESKKLN